MTTEQPLGYRRGTNAYLDAALDLWNPRKSALEMILMMADDAALASIHRYCKRTRRVRLEFWLNGTCRAVTRADAIQQVEAELKKRAS